jgi:hypothetical protein
VPSFGLTHHKIEDPNRVNFRSQQKSSSTLLKNVSLNSDKFYCHIKCNNEESKTSSACRHIKKALNFFYSSFTYDKWKEKKSCISSIT